MPCPGPLRSRLLVVVAKTVWTALAAYAVWSTTGGLAASFYIEPTSDALAAERHGQTVVAWAALGLVGLAVLAWFAFDPPRWAVLLLCGVALALVLASHTEWAYLFIPLPYLLVPGAAYGVVMLPRSRTDSTVSRG